QQACVPALRVSKVATKLLYHRFGEQARQEVVGELIQEVYPQALEQTELKPAVQPQLDLDEVKAGEPLEFTASFDVYPDIELTGLGTISVEKPGAEVTDADVEKT